MCNTKKYKIFAAYLQKKKKKKSAAAARLKAAFLQPQKFYNSHEILVKKTKSVDLLSNETFLKKNILCKRRFGISYQQYTTYILLHIISPVDWLAGGELRRGNISLVQLLQSRQKFFLAKALSTKVNTQIELSFKNDSNDQKKSSYLDTCMNSTLLRFSGRDARTLCENLTIFYNNIS